ncbi:hypothetical protein WM08_17265 [Burkholderia ubonensis]|uniref:hypothetical protein n=1 Tax=Burkholderia ubonensis TaxID=101571 RepID=UPI00076CBE20|nr:hypothetical protein [Burkholderia ubonensis]KWI87184.1 hypothetical protein WM08_17265 [Burkholderia ubonensis]
MDVPTISAALGALKTSFDLARTAVAARDDAKLADALRDINERIFQVQNASLQVQEKMSAMRDEIETLKDGKRQLSARITELEHQKSEREKYHLHELSKGVFVLAEKEPSTDGRSPHFLCQPCMDNSSKKAVLNRVYRSYAYFAVCPVCKNEYLTGEHVDISF